MLDCNFIRGLNLNAGTALELNHVGKILSVNTESQDFLACTGHICEKKRMKQLKMSRYRKSPKWVTPMKTPKWRIATQMTDCGEASGDAETMADPSESAKMRRSARHLE